MPSLEAEVAPDELGEPDHRATPRVGEISAFDHRPLRGTVARWSERRAVGQSQVGPWVASMKTKWLNEINPEGLDW